MYAGQIDLVHKADKRGMLWVSGTTFNFQTVYPAIIDSLQRKKGQQDGSKCESQGNVMVSGLQEFVAINYPHLLIEFDSAFLTLLRLKKLNYFTSTSLY